jgi:hypothetical protein
MEEGKLQRFNSIFEIAIYEGIGEVCIIKKVDE